jgi:hypothetical protein
VTNIKLKAKERDALEALARGEVMGTKTRKNFATLEGLGLSERYLSTANSVRVWKWKISPAGRAWLASTLILTAFTLKAWHHTLVEGMKRMLA